MVGAAGKEGVFLLEYPTYTLVEYAPTQLDFELQLIKQTAVFTNCRLLYIIHSLTIIYFYFLLKYVFAKPPSEVSRY